MPGAFPYTALAENGGAPGSGNVAGAKNRERTRVMDLDLVQAKLQSAFERGTIPSPRTVAEGDG
jgi:hypothetical protein